MWCFIYTVVFCGIRCQRPLLWHVVFYPHRGILRNQMSATVSPGSAGIISVFHFIFCKPRLLWHVVFYLHRGILRNRMTATASLACGVLSTPWYSAESDVSDFRSRLGRHYFSVWSVTVKLPRWCEEGRSGCGCPSPGPTCPAGKRRAGPTTKTTPR